MNLIAETLAHTHECRLEEREVRKREEKIRLRESKRKRRLILKRAKRTKRHVGTCSQANIRTLPTKLTLVNDIYH